MKKFLHLFIFSCASFSLSGQSGPIIWEEDFNQLDTATWNIVTGDGCDEGLCGWGNQELESYQAGNVSIMEIEGEPGNFALSLEARREISGNSSFTSGKISSENKLALHYGMVEIRMKSPSVEDGLWPAAWLLGTNQKAVGWPRCGEMDLMEMGQRADEIARQGFPGISPDRYVGANLLWYDPDACADDNQTCAASIAYDTWYNTPYVPDAGMSDRFIIYRMYWDEEEIRFTAEDEGVEHELYTGPFPIGSGEKAFTKPFYLLLNLAVGGIFTDAATEAQVTAPLPGKMIVDYIRVRKWNGKGEIITSKDLDANAGSDIKVDEGKPVQLNGSGSMGEISRYSWMVNGVEVATGINPSLNLEAGSYTVTLIVYNSEGESDEDNIQVNVGEQLIGEVIWMEDFSSLDTTLWNIVTGDGCDEGLCGWGNAELQSYQKDNAYIEEIPGEPGNHALVLEARKEETGNSAFTSGKVDTEKKVAIKYGVVEVRMMVPDLEDGLWPAAWLLGTSHQTVGWPRCGEIDMMEMGQSQASKDREGLGGFSANKFVGGNLIWYSGSACSADNASCAASIAYDTYYTTQYTPSSGMNNRFMTYRMYWDESHIRLTAIDGGTEHDLYTNPFPISAGEDAFRQPFYFLLNLAIGGNFTGLLNDENITAPMPAKMYIDYVKVSKWMGQGEVSLAGASVMAVAGEDLALSDQDRDGSELVSLDASGSYGNIISYEWFEEGAQIARGKEAIVELRTGMHHLTLRVSDAEGHVSEDDLKVDVREILWEETFDQLDTTTWNIVTGNGCDEGLCGWGNQELESYQESNLSIEEIEGEPGNHALVIEARRESAGQSEFTSGKVNTEGKLNLRYGVYELRMKVPQVETGLWPAAWLLGASQESVGWPACGEIDMMEMGHRSQEIDRQGFPGLSPNKYVGANVIWYSEDACSGDNLTCAASIANDHWYNTPYTSYAPLSSRYIIYRMYWNDQSIRLTLEDWGKERDFYTGPFPITGSEAAFRKPFYFLLNLAVGGNFTDAATAEQVSAPLPAKMYVDYVRVEKWQGQGEAIYRSGLVVDAGPDAIVIDKDGDGLEEFTLDGSGSYDLGGSIISWSWTLDGEEIAGSAISKVELSRGKQLLILEVTDDEGNTATDDLQVFVTSGALAPLANAGADSTYTDLDEDDWVEVTLDGSGSEPTDTPIISYTWSEKDQVLGTGEILSINLHTGLHLVDLTIVDEEGLEAMDQVIITIIDPDNIAPYADAGPDFSVEDPDGDDLAMADLDGSASNDVDGSIVSWSWAIDGNEILSGEQGSVELGTGRHLIQLEVRDDDGISSRDTVLVRIIDPDNEAPLADAGKDAKYVDEDRSGAESCLLDASGSRDADGEIVNFQWSENGIEIARGMNTSINLANGWHEIVLTLTDDDGDLSTDTVNIKVHEAPIARAGDDQFVLDEDASGNEDVQLDASLSEDPGGMIVAYNWYRGEVLLGSGSQLSLNFEIGTHLLNLEVTDEDGITATDSLFIIVSRTNNISPLAKAGTDLEVLDYDGDGFALVELDGSGSTDSDGFIYSHTWMREGKRIFSEAVAEILLPEGLHSLVLEVTDNEGASDRDTILISVNTICLFTACTHDFAALVQSENASGTTITFMPERAGVGDNLCLLYYGSSGTFPGYHVKPNEPFRMNVSEGQEISFYYTYSIPEGGENNTSGCQDHFTVGSCKTIPNENPVAVAGSDQVLEDVDRDGQEMVQLDGSGSYDRDGELVSYEWLEGNTHLASGPKASVILDAGVHTLTLKVIDEWGASDSDRVSITVHSTLGNEDINDREIAIYPVPMGDELHISLRAEEIEHARIFNARGVLVLESRFNNRLPVKELPEGLYIISITTKGGSGKYRVVK